MKNSVKQRMIATIIVSIVAMVSVFAQVNVSNTQLGGSRPAYTHTPWAVGNYDDSNSETATVGAEMPYYVVRDVNVNGGFFNASTFKWTWTAGEFSAVKGYDGALPVLTSGTETSYNFVVATMPAATGTSTLNIAEVSHPKVGTGCEDATPTSLTITVVDKPTLALPLNGTTGACSPAVQNIPLTLNGNAPYYVDYTISAVGLDGSTVVGSTKTYNAIIPVAVTSLEIDPSQLLHVADAANNLAPQVPGKYTVTVTKVWDKFSWKAINKDALAVAGTNTYDIYVYPTPTTQPIQHIKQL